MACYLLHRHEPDMCGVVFASFKGHHSPLRRRPTLASCRSGGLPPTRKRLEIKGMELVQVRDRKIVIDNLCYEAMAIPARSVSCRRARPRVSADSAACGCDTSPVWREGIDAPV